MSTITNGSMKLIKSDITDIIHSTIGSDLPNNFDKIDKTVDEVNTRINNILTTPVDGVSAQEIIDARGDSPTLGAKLNSMQTQTDSLQEEVDSLSTTGIPKLVSFDYDIAATTDNQTVFTIPYEYLSLASDTVEVFVNGIAVPDNYYIVTEPVEVESEITLGFVTLTEAKPTGTIVKVRILKNVPNGDEGSVDGDIITVDSIPVNRINSGELDEFMNDSLSDINTSLNDLANVKINDTENVIFYIDQVNGDDSNDGLTKNTPFKTIEQAINKIPYLSEFNYTLSLLSNYVIESNLVFKTRYINGGLTLTSANIDSPVTINIPIEYIVYFDSTTPLSIININFDGRVGFRRLLASSLYKTNFNCTDGEAALSLWNSNVEIRDCTFTSNTKCVYAMQTSNVNFRDGNILNGTGVGIHATRGSVVSQYNNTTALVNNCSTKKTISIGSQFVDYVSEDSGWINLPLTKGGSNSHICSYRKKDGRVQLKGRVTNLAEVGVFATLPSGFRINQNTIFICAMGGIQIAKIEVRTEGTITVADISTTITESLYIDLGSIEFYTN